MGEAWNPSPAFIRIPTKPNSLLCRKVFPLWAFQAYFSIQRSITTKNHQPWLKHYQPLISCQHVLDQVLSTSCILSNNSTTLSTYLFYAYPMIIAFHETVFALGILSNNLHAFSTCPHIVYMSTSALTTIKIDKNPFLKRI